MRVLLTVAIVSLSPCCLAQQNPIADLGSPPPIGGIPPLNDLPSVDSSRPLLDNFDTSGLGGANSGSSQLRELAPQPPAANPPQGASRYATPGRTAAIGSTVSTQASAQVRYAESLIKAALAAPSNSRLSGTGVGLSEVVAASGSRANQSSSIAAYWDLCSTVSDYYLSIYEQSELDRLARSSLAGAPLRAAQAKMKTRSETAFAAARATQLRLASLMRRGDTSPLPLPIDMPLVGVYRTHHEQMFRGGAPREATELNRLLPLRHTELLAAASAVAEAEDWYKAVAGRVSNDEGEGAVKALQLLALNRRAFVQITRDYNKRITRYTELARPGNLRTDRLVAMLIKTDRIAATQPRRPLPPGNRRSEITPPATFREDSQDPSRAAPPRVDTDILPAAAIGNPMADQFGTGEHSMVERIEPGETSVLNRKPAP